jgi:hypothetical protein
MPSSSVSYSHSPSCKNSTLSSNDNMTLSHGNSLYISYPISTIVFSITIILSHSLMICILSLSIKKRSMAPPVIILTLLKISLRSLILYYVLLLEIFHLNYFLLITLLFPLIYHPMIYSHKISISSLSSIFIINRCNWLYHVDHPNILKIWKICLKIMVIIRNLSLFWLIHNFFLWVTTYDTPFLLIREIMPYIKTLLPNLYF